MMLMLMTYCLSGLEAISCSAADRSVLTDLTALPIAQLEEHQTVTGQRVGLTNHLRVLGSTPSRETLLLTVSIVVS